MPNSRDRVERRGQDLKATVAEGAPVVRRALPDPDGHERDHQRGDVGEHVGGVGQQRDAVEDEAADDLGHQVGGRERERPAEHLRVRAGSMVVGMTTRSVIMRHASALL